MVGDLGRVEVKMIQPFHAKMIANLKVPKLHDAVKQNSIRYLSEAEIEKDPWGEAYDLAYRSIRSNNGKVAIKVFSMTLALNIVKKIPEFKEELRYSIKEQMPYGICGFKTVAVKR